MKMIHVAGTALAGMVVLAAVALQGRDLQTNPSGVTSRAPATKSSTAGSTTASSLNPAAAASQPSGRFSFDGDHANTIELQLRPDQTASLCVRVIYKDKPKAGADQPDENTEKRDTKDKAAIKKVGKKSTVGEKEWGKRNKSVSEGECVSRWHWTNQLTNTGTPIPLKFNLDLVPSGFSPCIAAVSPLVADRSWELNVPQEIPVNITSCSPNGGAGKLTIVGSSGKEGQLTVRLKARRSPRLLAATVASLGMAVLIVVICAAIIVVHGHKMGDRIGQASWDFSSSWASNITAFGTGITFLLGLTIFPDKANLWY